MSNFKYNNILLTGAAGALGEELREALSKSCKALRISDKAALNKNLKMRRLFKLNYLMKVKCWN